MLRKIIVLALLGGAMLSSAAFAQNQSARFKACQHLVEKSEGLGLTRAIEMTRKGVNVLVDADVWGRLSDEAKQDFVRTVSCWAMKGAIDRQAPVRVIDYQAYAVLGNDTLSLE